MMEIQGKALVIAPTSDDYERLIAKIALQYRMKRAEVRQSVVWLTEAKKLRGYREAPTVWLYADWYRHDSTRDLVVYCEEHDIPTSDPPIREFASRV